MVVHLLLLKFSMSYANGSVHCRLEAENINHWAKHHFKAGLQFYRFWIQLLHYIQITTYFLFSLPNPVLLSKRPGASPIKILQRKFYAMLIFKDPDWLINLSSQSECLKKRSVKFTL